jgi:hypothetical protein
VRSAIGAVAKPRAVPMEQGVYRESRKSPSACSCVLRDTLTRAGPAGPWDGAQLQRTL